ncbi:MAG: glycosyltransferase family 2 protein [Verrucomicrobiia bacterium]
MTDMQGTIPKPLFCGTGWPWVGSLCESHNVRRSAEAEPRISVVMPSYNQGAFIEKAIRSVLMQDHANLELIVMDGGSTDDSVKVIRHYADRLAHWQSGRDTGQPQAINRGMEKATGDLVAWLNSDDFFMPGAFRLVAREYKRSQSHQWIVGVTSFFDEQGRFLYEWIPVSCRSLGETLSQSAGTPQTSSFWGLDLWRDVGGLDENLHYCMDEDLFMKFYIAGARPRTLSEHLAVMVIQRDSKTSAHQSRFSRDFSRIVLRNRRHVPDSEISAWRVGVRNMAHNYGLQAWRCFRSLDARAAWDFMGSGARLSLSRMVWGMTRGVGSALKQCLCGRDKESTFTEQG